MRAFPAFWVTAACFATTVAVLVITGSQAASVRVNNEEAGPPQPWSSGRGGSTLHQNGAAEQLVDARTRLAQRLVALKYPVLFEHFPDPGSIISTIVTYLIDLFHYAEYAEFAVSTWNNQNKDLPLTLRTIMHWRNTTTEASPTPSYYMVLFTERPTLFYGDQAFVRLSVTVSGVSGSMIATGFTYENITYNGLCDVLSAAANCQCDEWGHCKRGTVHVDEWLSQSLAFQRNLTNSLPLRYHQFLHSHDAYNNRADGYGGNDNLWGWLFTFLNPGEEIIITDQEFSITDQLRLGMRAFHLSLHWENEDVRLCHSHAPDGFWNPLVDSILELYYLLTGHRIEWDLNNIGCSPWDRPWSHAVREIAQWLAQPENQQEVLWFLFEDHAHWTWGHDDLVNGVLEKYWGDVILSPADKKKFWPNLGDGEFPSVDELLAKGKRVIIASLPDGTHGGKWIFERWWVEMGLEGITPYPVCSLKGNWTRTWGDSLCYPPIMNNCVKDTGTWLTTTNFPLLIDCDINIVGGDLMTADLMASALWTWAPGYPISSSSKANTNNNCVAMRAEDGRWINTDCNRTLAFACMEPHTREQWQLSSVKAQWEVGNYNAGGKVCMFGGETWQFGYPYLPSQAAHLRDLMKRQSISEDVWIRFKL
ncbi:C-type lectin domain-containing protein [Balamuthia mandrillaris]